MDYGACLENKLAGQQPATGVRIPLAPLENIIDSLKKYGSVAERSIAADCKSVSQDAVVRIHPGPFYTLGGYANWVKQAVCKTVTLETL